MDHATSHSKQYYRLMLGAKSVFAAECFAGNFVGADFGIEQDLTNELPDHWKEFNKRFRPVWLKQNPGKSKVAAGLDDDLRIRRSLAVAPNIEFYRYQVSLICLRRRMQACLTTSREATSFCHRHGPRLVYAFRLVVKLCRQTENGIN